MFVLCCRTVVLFVCLSASLLSVCDAGVLWPNGWTDQAETWVGLHPCHIVLDGDPAPLPKGHSPPILCPYLLWLNGWIGWIKMPLGREGGLSPSDIVLDGDPAPLPKIGDTAPTIFGSCLLWTNGYMDQDVTWYGGRPRPKSHCARWGPSPPKGGKWGHCPIFGPCLLWPNCWMDQDETWLAGRPRPWPHW